MSRKRFRHAYSSSGETRITWWFGGEERKQVCSLAVLFSGRVVLYIEEEERKRRNNETLYKETTLYHPDTDGKILNGENLDTLRSIRRATPGERADRRRLGTFQDETTGLSLSRRALRCRRSTWETACLHASTQANTIPPCAHIVAPLPTSLDWNWIFRRKRTKRSWLRTMWCH